MSAPEFEIVSSMETDITAAEDFARAIALMAETIDEEGVASSVQRLAWTVIDCIKRTEERRGKLFRMTHPNRSHFDEVGWPGDAGREVLS